MRRLIGGIDRQDVEADALGFTWFVEEPVALGLGERRIDGVAESGLSSRMWAGLSSCSPSSSLLSGSSLRFFSAGRRNLSTRGHYIRIRAAESTPRVPDARTRHNGVVPVFPALQHRNFRLLWSGLLVSFSGNFMQTAAILWHVSLLAPDDERALALGLVGLVRVVPVIVFSLLSGVAADALDRRQLMLVTQSMMALPGARPGRC